MPTKKIPRGMQQACKSVVWQPRDSRYPGIQKYEYKVPLKILSCIIINNGIPVNPTYKYAIPPYPSTTVVQMCTSG
jgi:hypothetical protein